MSRPKPPRADTTAAQHSKLLADLSVAIRTGAMTRVAAAQALLDAIDPTTLSSELVLEVLRAEDAYPETSAMRTSMDAELLDLVAVRKGTRKLLD